MIRKPGKYLKDIDEYLKEIGEKKSTSKPTPEGRDKFNKEIEKMHRQFKIDMEKESSRQKNMSSEDKLLEEAKIMRKELERNRRGSSFDWGIGW